MYLAKIFKKMLKQIQLAIKIQTWIRRYLAQCKLFLLKKIRLAQKALKLWRNYLLKKNLKRLFLKGKAIRIYKWFFFHQRKYVFRCFGRLCQVFHIYKKFIKRMGKTIFHSLRLNYLKKNHKRIRIHRLKLFLTSF